MAVKITKEFTCDRCNGPMHDTGEHERGDNGTITVRESHWCREGGTSPKWSLDLCGDCVNSLNAWKRREVPDGPV